MVKYDWTSFLPGREKPLEDLLLQLLDRGFLLQLDSRVISPGDLLLVLWRIFLLHWKYFQDVGKHTWCDLRLEIAETVSHGSSLPIWDQTSGWKVKEMHERGTIIRGQDVLQLIQDFVSAFDIKIPYKICDSVTISGFLIVILEISKMGLCNLFRLRNWKM